MIQVTLFMVVIGKTVNQKRSCPLNEIAVL